MKPNTKDNIIDSIKKAECRPRWHFVLRNGIFWFFGVVTTLVGGVAIATSIFVMVNRETLPLKMVSGQSTAFLAIVPYIWIGLVVLFVTLGEISLRHTDKGYKYSLVKVLLAHVGVSLVLGLAFFAVKIGYHADQVASKTIPSYRAVAQQEIYNWFDPEAGFLVGAIIDRGGDQEFVLQDPEAKVWQVVLIANHKPSQRTTLNVDRVRMVGYVQGDNVFHACRIAPFVLRGGPKEVAFRHKEDMRRLKQVARIQTERMDEYLRTNGCDLAKETSVISN